MVSERWAGSPDVPVGGGCAAHLGARLGQTRHLPSLQGLLLTAGWEEALGRSWKGFMGSLKCEEMLSAF